jgi:excisionase family DNA binding protein
MRGDVVYAPEVLTISQAADVLQLGRMTLWRRTKDGTIRSIRIGGAIRIPRSEIDRLLTQDPEGARADAP